MAGKLSGPGECVADRYLLRMEAIRPDLGRADHALARVLNEKSVFSIVVLAVH
ncbi:hypothetical protein [Bradyrhizobium sp. USDA 4538]|uniref:hypothetical protein n=1 Tax=Bradyrhizobium sp. USDA 4538 TaxID=2817702 RepID=UPI0020A4645E|nr:hypothetical protein [Bradyrhizobium sp. USDA 4538]